MSTSVKKEKTTRRSKKEAESDEVEAPVAAAAAASTAEEPTIGTRRKTTSATKVAEERVVQAQPPSKFMMFNLGDLDEEALSSYFGSFGDVVSVNVIRSHYNQRSKGYGFVEVVGDEVVQAILDQEMHEIGDQTIKVGAFDPDHKKSHKAQKQQQQHHSAPRSKAPQNGHSTASASHRLAEILLQISQLTLEAQQLMMQAQ